MATLPDLAATRDAPAEIQERLRRARAYITGAGGKAEASRLLRPVEGAQDAWEVSFPAGAVAGLRGLTGERIARRRQELARPTHTEPFRPEWVGQTYQPRLTTPFPQRTPLRRLNGKAVEPYYGVYPPDQRQVFYPSTYPWRCVGRIFTWTDFSQPNWTWSGSGVLVGPRHVLTAGHVAPWGSQHWAMLFVPAYYDGASLAGAGATSWVSDYRGWNTNDTVAAHDMCVLRLYDADLGPSLGWMGSKVYDTSWQNGPYWTLAGYPGLIAGAQRPSYQSGIPVLDDDSDSGALEIEHHGSATAGDSGGPFFGFWSDGPYTIGTVSGGEQITGGFLGIGDEDNNINAGGEAMVDLILWARANWP
jgi:V8-like Glu-specific endopeptidase